MSTKSGEGGSETPDDVRGLATEILGALNPFEVYQLVGHLLVPLHLKRDVALTQIRVELEGRNVVALLWDDTDAKLCDSLVNILRASLCDDTADESDAESEPNPGQ
jgi:hypothetical protein